MWKKVLLIIGILLAIFLLGIGWATYYFYPSADRVLKFVKKHPEKSAIHVLYNNRVLISQHADTVMPLASAVKTIIAIEFAYSAAYALIDTAARIDTLELDRFYVPETDGGAHAAWMDHMREHKLLQNGTVSLYAVAKGMMQYSSNANAEYLMDILGLTRINARIDSLGILAHQPLYPFVAALFVCQNTQRKDHKTYENDLRAMSMNEYRAACLAYHDSLKNNPQFKNSFVQSEMDLSIQKIWSQRLPGSSCREYAQLMQKINSDSAFTEPVYATVRSLMDWPSSSFRRFGRKGGSTATVLTDACYATDMQNNTTELAVFFNNLTVLENLKLQMSLVEFEKRIMQDSSFRTQLINQLNP
jgi:D-alanyl-D-alanine carboxypeptidase